MEQENFTYWAITLLVPVERGAVSRHVFWRDAGPIFNLYMVRQYFGFHENTTIQSFYELSEEQFNYIQAVPKPQQQDDHEIPEESKSED